MKSLMLLAVAFLMVSSSVQAQQYSYPASASSCCSQYGCNTTAPVSGGYISNQAVYSQGNYSMPNGTMVYATNEPFVDQGGYYPVGTSMPAPATTIVSNQVIQPGYSPSLHSQPAPVSTYAVGPSYVQPVSTGSYSMNSVTPQYASYNATSGSGLAQSKAQQAAQSGIQGHVGGGLGNANYEGVGWSSASAQDAIQRCCYWGTRPVEQIGVARGQNGLWYACVLYR